MVLTLVALLAQSGCGLCWPRGGAMEQCIASDDDDDTGDDDDAGDDDDTGDDGMVDVPLGSVEMGCDEDLMTGPSSCDSDEVPLHVVTISAFRLDAWAVTNEDFVAFLNAHGNDCGEADCLGGFSEPEISESAGVWSVLAGAERWPVMETYWYGARDYCAWVGKRLPTEAEWARAARGDVPALYVWGAAEPDCKHAIYGDGCGEGHPWAVDDGIRVLGRSPFGAWDMSGNSWEWVQDRYAADYYEWSPGTDPQGPATGDSRVVRGGGWDSNSSMLRVWTRWGRSMNLGNDSVGFRCAATP